MCADKIPEDIASNGRLRRQTINLPCHPENLSVYHKVDKVTDLVSAITSFEGIVMERVHTMSYQKFAWIQICRTYFYTMLHASWLQLRLNFNAITANEARNYNNLISNKNFYSKLLPTSIANEIVRISIPSQNRKLNNACFPSVRPGLLLSKLFTDPATGLRTRHVHITDEHERLPSVLLSQNMTWLLANRNTLASSCGMSMNAILCALLNGSFIPTEFIINNGEYTEERLFRSICFNPALAVPTTCPPDVYAMSFDLLKSDPISNPIDSDDVNAPNNLSIPTWLEPQLTSTTFDACNAKMAEFSSFYGKLTSFKELDLPHAFLDFDDAYNLYVQFRRQSDALKPNFDPNFWFDAIHTRATGSA